MTRNQQSQFCLLFGILFGNKNDKESAKPIILILGKMRVAMSIVWGKVICSGLYLVNKDDKESANPVLSLSWENKCCCGYCLGYSNSQQIK